MSDNKKEDRDYARIPNWDGSALGMIAFEKDIKWWLASESKIGVADYNIAARLVNRQTNSAVKERAQLQSPDSLWQENDHWTTDGYWVLGDPRKGIDILIADWKVWLGKTAQNLKGDARNRFYKETSRRDGEQMKAWITRYRDMRAALSLVNADIQEADSGWHLKEKSNLSVEDTQLLDIALERHGGDEAAQTIVEGQLTKLFPNIHNRRRPSAPNKLHNASRKTPWDKYRSPSSLSSRAPSSSSRLSSFSSRSSSSSSRAHAAEAEDEDTSVEAQAAEDAPSEAESQPVDDLEGLVVSEMEVLTTVLEEAQDGGFASKEQLEILETAGEQIAEEFLSLKEIHGAIAKEKAKRGCAFPPASSGNRGRYPTPADRKKDSLCDDCNEAGHWAGDAACKKPGAKLGPKYNRSKAKTKPKAKTRRAHIAEEEDAESNVVEAEAMTSNLHLIHSDSDNCFSSSLNRHQRRRRREFLQSNTIEKEDAICSSDEDDRPGLVSSSSECDSLTSELGIVSIDLSSLIQVVQMI